MRRWGAAGGAGRPNPCLHCVRRVRGLRHGALQCHGAYAVAHTSFAFHLVRTTPRQAARLLPACLRSASWPPGCSLRWSRCGSSSNQVTRCRPARAASRCRPLAWARMPAMPAGEAALLVDLRALLAQPWWRPPAGQAGTPGTPTTHSAHLDAQRRSAGRAGARASGAAWLPKRRMPQRWNRSWRAGPRSSSWRSFGSRWGRAGWWVGRGGWWCGVVWGGAGGWLGGGGAGGWVGGWVGRGGPARVRFSVIGPVSGPDRRRAAGWLSRVAPRRAGCAANVQGRARPAAGRRRHAVENHTTTSTRLSKPAPAT